MKPTPRTDAALKRCNQNTCDVGLPDLAIMLDHARDLERELDDAKILAGELIAMIRVNVMRETFRDATIEQVDEHLKPWIERLNGKASHTCEWLA